MQESQRPVFATTQWSLILEAGNQSAPEAERALAELCEAYWFPLYAFARRHGYSPDDAADRTQEFFSRLIEHSLLGSANRERGRFRTFLLTLFQRFLAKEYQKDQTIKRGGRFSQIPFDIEEVESRVAARLSDQMTAERVFEQEWALTVLHRTVERLREEYEFKGKSELFARCQTMLTGNAGDTGYRQIALDLKLSEGALRVAVHRLRERFRDLLRQEVAGTVETAREIDDELLSLRRALAGTANP